MRRSAKFAVFVVLVVALAALVGCGSGSGSSSGGYGSSTPPASSGSSAGNTTPGATGGVAVAIKNFAFSPSKLTVKVGDKVTFTNNDSTTHTVTGDGFSSGDIAPGASWTNTFSKAGTFAYHCSIHPTMTGSITVQ